MRLRGGAGCKTCPAKPGWFDQPGLCVCLVTFGRNRPTLPHAAILSQLIDFAATSGFNPAQRFPAKIRLRGHEAVNATPVRPTSRLAPEPVCSQRRDELKLQVEVF